MNYKELMKQPNNILFYEEGLPAPALYQKVDTIEDDIIVRQFDAEFEQSRMGFREMEETDKNSKDYCVFTKEQLDTLNSYFTLAYFEAK